MLSLACKPQSSGSVKAFLLLSSIVWERGGDSLKYSLPLIYSHYVKHDVPSSEVCRLISSALINHSVLTKQSGNKWRFDQSCRWAFKPPYASCSFLTQRSKHIVLSRIKNGRKPIQTHVWSPRSVSYFTVGHYCSLMWNQ